MSDLTGKGRPIAVTDDAIVAALASTGGSVRAAAAAVGMTRQGLYYRLTAHEDLRWRARRAGWSPARRVG